MTVLDDLIEDLPPLRREQVRAVEDIVACLHEIVVEGDTRLVLGCAVGAMLERGCSRQEVVDACGELYDRLDKRAKNKPAT